AGEAGGGGGGGRVGFLPALPALPALLGGDDEMPAPVHRVTGLGHLHAELLLLALADGEDAIARNPQARQVIAHRGGAAFTEREVVLVGAARVGVPLDRHLD